jgi:hypothetical protein
MSSNPPNFDIRNYTINDLKDIFELPNNFDSNVIEIKETKLREKLLSNPKLTPKLKQDTIQFITSAKIKLQENIKSVKEIMNPHPYIIEKPIIEGKDILQERTLKKHLNVDTRFRDNFQQSSSNFDINLSFKLANVKKMELSSIEFPTTFYAISKVFGNNFFTIRIDVSGEGIKEALFELPDGNYSRSAIINALNNSSNYTLTTDDTSTDEIFDDINFDVDVDGEGSGTGKMFFTLDSSLTILNQVNQVELLFNENISCQPDSNALIRKLGWMLGFRNGSYVSTNENNNNFEIISESLLNITGPKYIYMAIDDHNSNNESTSNFYSAFNSVILQKNILARIPLTTFSFSFEIANMLSIVSTPREYTNPVSIEKIGIQLMDEYGRILDLNEMNISFCLSFTQSYEGSNSTSNK